MIDCLFCKIAQGAIPCEKAFEDEKVLAFFDIKPQAPVHILVIPKAHIPSLNGLDASNAALVSHMLLAANSIAQEQGIDAAGYRVVFNTGANGGQTVPHLHLHLLGGRALSWPPG